MICKANSPFPIGYADANQTSGLFVRAQIDDITGALVSLGHVNLVEESFGCYSAKFAGGADNKIYSVKSIVYTDGTYTTPDPNFAPVKTEIQFIDFAAASQDGVRQDLLLVLESDGGANSPVEYVQGQSMDFVAQLAVKDRFGLVRPADLTGNTEITMIWRAGSSIIKKNRVAVAVGVTVVGAPTEGKVKGSLLATETDSQPKTSSGLLEVVVTNADGSKDKYQAKSSFIVSEKADA